VNTSILTIVLVLAGETSTATIAVLPPVTVTASRRPRPLRTVPLNVTVLPRAEIERHPSATTDMLLRTVPSAQTFRRSTSMVADPTAQGLNLRGVAPSGVSRSLVLLEGLQMNDPFGGSVYWRALPRLGLERMEIVPGGGSALYGSAALGGVVELFERPITGDRVEADLSAGTQSTALIGARATVFEQAIRASLETEWARSDGYRIVSEDARGPVDAETPSEHLTVLGKVEVDVYEDVLLTARLSYFDEDQNGGTSLTTAGIEQLRSSLRLELGDQLRSVLTLSAGFTSFEQTRARISPQRDRETLSATQQVPTNDQSLQYYLSLPVLESFGEHQLSTGVELRRVEGESRERVTGGTYRVSGGEQRFLGLYIQDLISFAPRFEVSLALRGDLVDRLDPELSPRAGILFRPIETFAVRGSIYRSFRAPTISELYRSFQVGTVRTAANAGLGPEHLFGGEVGLDVTPSSWWNLRLTGFWARLDDPIVNATLAEPLPDGSTRQRQNLGEARVRGVEAGVEGKLWRHLSLLLSYTFVDAAVTEHPTLRGKRLPQDPKHRATALLSFRDPSLLFATVELKWLSSQYEDDLNTQELDRVFLLSASLGVPLTRGIEVYAAAENLLNQEYLVGRAGIDTIGAPFTLRGGVRFVLGL
jgi:outer membrane receptor protein involved in Fe transport